MAEIEYTASVKMRNMTCQQHLLVTITISTGPAEKSLKAKHTDGCEVSKGSQKPRRKKKCGFIEHF